VSGVSGNRLRAPGPLPPRLTSRSAAGRPLAEVPLTGLSFNSIPCSTLDYFPTTLDILGFKMTGQPEPGTA